MLWRQRESSAVSRARSCGVSSASIEVGILTRGKATLGIALTSVLLQDVPGVRVHIVDTSDSPVVNRDDVTLAMRLAFDRNIYCSYERLRDRKRGFSLGRLRLLEVLSGELVCFIDDDMAFGASMMRQLLAVAAGQQGTFGCIRPICRNATLPLGVAEDACHYTPGSLLHLDGALRQALAAYYESTVDVVDPVKSEDKVWEVAFLGELLHRLGRPCLSAPEAVIYHLDHHELRNWSVADGGIIRRSVNLARQLACPQVAEPLAV